MGLNKTKIDWATHSWSPITGCNHLCPYCYARDMANRFASKLNLTYVDGVVPAHLANVPYPYGFIPTFYPHRLNDPAKLKKPAHIFCVSMGDMFGDWVPDEWITRVFIAIDDNPQHTYTILTKNPNRLLGFSELIPDNCIVGTSITGKMDDAEVGRLQALAELSGVRKVVSLEPMLHMNDGLLRMVDDAKIDWLIIGGQTGRNPFKPKNAWIDGLIAQVSFERGIPVFVKDNCGYPLTVREYPDGVPHE